MHTSADPTWWLTQLILKWSHKDSDSYDFQLSIRTKYGGSLGRLNVLFAIFTAGHLRRWTANVAVKSYASKSQVLSMWIVEVNL